MDAECAFEVVVTDVEKDAFDAVITKADEDAFDVVISGGGGGSSDSKAGALVDTVSGSIASFYPDSTVPTVKGLTVNIEPVQSGSGDPSPDNIRPISGWDEVNVTVSPTTEAEDGRTYTIEMPTEAGTVYGGTLDVINGVLTVDRAMVDLGTLTWNYISGSNFNLRSTNAIGALPPITLSTTPRAISSIYPALSYAEVSGTDKSLAIVFATSGQAGKVWVHDSSYTDAQTFKTAVSGQTLVYELATPIAIDLTPIEVAVITGQTNNIWADSGDVSVEYAADLKTYIDNKIAAAVAALS